VGIVLALADFRFWLEELDVAILSPAATHGIISLGMEKLLFVGFLGFESRVIGLQRLKFFTFLPYVYY
jgi:hypothetical protein